MGRWEDGMIRKRVNEIMGKERMEIWNAKVFLNH